MQQEMNQTIDELAGAPYDQIIGALAGTVVAAFREMSARLDVLERIVLQAEELPVGQAGLVELPVGGALVGDEAPRGQVVYAPPVATAPPESPGEAVPLIAPPAAISRDEVLRRRQAQVASVPVAAAPMEVVSTEPVSELDRLRKQRAELEARVAMIRQRAVQVSPVAALGIVAPTSMPMALDDPGLPYEIRHTEGPLIGRPDMVGMPLRHATMEAAQAAINLIAASKPGWRDRLAIFDRRLP